MDYKLNKCRAFSVQQTTNVIIAKILFFEKMSSKCCVQYADCNNKIGIRMGFLFCKTFCDSQSGNKVERKNKKASFGT